MSVQRMCALLVGGVFAALAFVKLASGYQAAFSLPAWLFWLATGGECLVAVLAVCGRVAPAMNLGMLYSLGAMLASVAFRGKCGCLGAVGQDMSGATRFALAGLIGVLCALCRAVGRAKTADPAIHAGGKV